MTLSRPFFDNDCKCYKLRVAIYEAYRHCSLHGHAPSRGVLKPKSVRRRSPSGVTSTQSRTVGAKLAGGLQISISAAVGLPSEGSTVDGMLAFGVPNQPPLAMGRDLAFLAWCMVGTGQASAQAHCVN